MSLDISISEVFNHINKINLNSNPGIDDIPPVFIRACIYIMSRVFWLLFNKSLSSGIFPAVWKTCIVTPIFKGGDKNLISNYRPISKQCIIPKLFENIIAGKLSSLAKNIIIREQHGFMTGRSVVTNLLVYHDFIVTLEERLQLDAIYTDFTKAFDSVDHNILLRKLRALGINGTLLK